MSLKANLCLNVHPQTLDLHIIIPLGPYPQRAAALKDMKVERASKQYRAAAPRCAAFCASAVLSFNPSDAPVWFNRSTNNKKRPQTKLRVHVKPN